jgi:anaerobic magnesium-protoporphyrin IX monomethyl ester cyclase
MTTDLLLTHGYFLHEDPKELQVMKPYVPMGMLYLCSHLRAKGFRVDVFDSTFSSKADLYSTLRTTNPTVLGIYANLMTRPNVVEIIQEAKSNGWKVIVGGPEPGAYAEEYLRAGADAVVIGEGECTLEELLPALKAGASLERVAGVAFLDATGAVQTTIPRRQIEDLDAQPWPARETVDINRYLDSWRKAHGTGSVSFITARGCPYKCQWCSHQVFGHTHRRRSPVKVVDEIEWIVDRYSPDMVWAADDVFTIHHGWLKEYAAEMRRRNLHIPFECISRADRINTEAADLLVELGCFRLWIGSESGSQRILDSMQRGVTAAQVRSATKLLRDRGIQTGMFLMWGYEGETLLDIEETVEHVKATDPDIFFTTVAYPIKGTPYYEQVKDRLVQLKPWATGSDREIKIRGRHSRNYYQHADHLLRSEVELARAKRGAVAHDSLTSLEQQIQAAREGLKTSFNEVEL